MITRFPVNISLSEQAKTRLGIMAEDRGIKISALVEQLIEEAWDTEPNYMLKQIAIQSFVSAALSIATAKHVLGAEAAAQVRAQATKAAATLFGDPPKKRFGVRDGVEADPRVEALYTAYEGE